MLRRLLMAVLLLVVLTLSGGVACTDSTGPCIRFGEVCRTSSECCTGRCETTTRGRVCTESMEVPDPV